MGGGAHSLAYTYLAGLRQISERDGSLMCENITDGKSLENNSLMSKCSMHRLK